MCGGLSPAEVVIHKRHSAIRYGQLAVPALILCGRHDPQVPIRQSELLRAGIPCAELVAFEESGHFPYAEKSEKFRATVRRFVRDLYPDLDASPNPSPAG